MPFDDKDVKKMLKVQLEGRIKFPSKIQERLDPLLKDLICHMLEVDVTKRFNIDKVLKHMWLQDVPLNVPNHSIPKISLNHTSVVNTREAILNRFQQSNS